MAIVGPARSAWQKLKQLIYHKDWWTFFFFISVFIMTQSWNILPLQGCRKFWRHKCNIIKSRLPEVKSSMEKFWSFVSSTTSGLSCLTNIWLCAHPTLEPFCGSCFVLPEGSNFLQQLLPLLLLCAENNCLLHL